MMYLMRRSALGIRDIPGDLGFYYSLENYFIIFYYLFLEAKVDAKGIGEAHVEALFEKVSSFSKLSTRIFLSCEIM